MPRAVLKLHRSLRDCVDIMGVGVGLPRADHVAEEGVVSSAPASAGTKDVGDVRRALVCRAQWGSKSRFCFP